MKFRAKRGHGIPPGLMTVVDAVQWKKEGDHPAVLPAPKGLTHTTGIVEIRNEKHFSTQLVEGIVRNTDADGMHHDHIVMKDYWIITNPAPDNKVWALSPEHMAAWFEKA